jgi:hypothetical protein
MHEACDPITVDRHRQQLVTKKRGSHDDRDAAPYRENKCHVRINHAKLNDKLTVALIRVSVKLVVALRLLQKFLKLIGCFRVTEAFVCVVTAEVELSWLVHFLCARSHNFKRCRLVVFLGFWLRRMMSMTIGSASLHDTWLSYTSGNELILRENKLEVYSQEQKLGRSRSKTSVRSARMSLCS